MQIRCSSFCSVSMWAEDDRHHGRCLTAMDQQRIWAQSLFISQILILMKCMNFLATLLLVWLIIFRPALFCPNNVWSCLLSEQWQLETDKTLVQVVWHYFSVTSTPKKVAENSSETSKNFISAIETRWYNQKVTSCLWTTVKNAKLYKTIM